MEMYERSLGRRVNSGDNLLAAETEAKSCRDAHELDLFKTIFHSPRIFPGAITGLIRCAIDEDIYLFSICLKCATLFRFCNSYDKLERYCWSKNHPHVAGLWSPILEHSHFEQKIFPSAEYLAITSGRSPFSLVD